MSSLAFTDWDFYDVNEGAAFSSSIFTLTDISNFSETKSLTVG